MAETLANFLIELGVDAGSSLKRIETIEKKLRGLNQIKGLNQEIKTIDRKIGATHRAAQAQKMADKEFLRDAKARNKIHKMWEQNDKALERQKQQRVQKELQAIKMLGQRQRKLAQDEKKRQDQSTRQSLERRKIERQLNSVTSSGLQKQVGLIQQASKAWDGNRAKLGHIKQDIVELKDKEQALATRAKQHARERRAQLQQQSKDLKKWALEQNQAQKQRARDLRYANSITRQRMRLLRQLEGVSNETLKSERDDLERNIRAWRGSGVALDSYKDRLLKLTRRQRELNKELKRGSFVANGFRDSLRNMGRSYLSVFAAISAGVFINRTAQEFESLKNAMIATSGSLEDADKDFDFVKGKAQELGIALKPAVDGFAKLSVAGQDIFSREEISEMWTGLSESITAFGLSSDDAKGSYRAVMQMMSKGKVTAEELRQQLGERMPIAMQALGRSTGWGTEKLDDLLQKGEVGLEVLPGMIKEMRKMSRQGGLLGKQMNSLRAEQNRFNLAVQEAVVLFADSGFKEGAANMFREMTKGIEAAKPAIKALGKAIKPILSFIGTTFRVLGEVLGFVTKAVGWVIDQFKVMSTTTNALAAALGAGVLGKLFGFGKAAKAVGQANKALKVMRAIGIALGAIFLRPLVLGFAVIGLLDEIMNIFRKDEDKKIGLFSAPEGHEAGLFDLQDAMAGLMDYFKNTWKSIEELFSFDTIVDSWMNSIASLKKLWSEFLVWMGLRQEQLTPEEQRRQDKITRDVKERLQSMRDVTGPGPLRMSQTGEQAPSSALKDIMRTSFGTTQGNVTNDTRNDINIEVNIPAGEVRGDPRETGRLIGDEVMKRLKREQSGDYVPN